MKYVVCQKSNQMWISVKSDTYAYRPDCEPNYKWFNTIEEKVVQYNNTSEYTHKMCGKDGGTVMCRRSPKDDFDHYGTHWYGYRDTNNKLYYGR